MNSDTITNNEDAVLLVDLTNIALPGDINTNHSSIPDLQNLIAGSFPSLVEMHERLVEINVIASPESADKFTEYNTHSVLGVYMKNCRINQTTKQSKLDLVGYFLIFRVLMDSSGDQSAQALVYRTPKPCMPRNGSKLLTANTIMKYLPKETPLGRMFHDALSSVPALSGCDAKKREMTAMLNVIMFSGDACAVAQEQVDFEPSQKL